jgi:hypothetical protein
MTPFQRSARSLAETLVEAPWPWSVDDLVERASRALGRRPRWLRPLVRRLANAFPDRRPRFREVLAFLADDAKYRRGWASNQAPRKFRPGPRPTMAPAPGPPSTWPVPVIVTIGELAAFLGLEPAELDWLADLRGIERTAREGPLRRYDYRWKPKRNGSTRLIEAPRGRLKAIQRRIAREILDAIPPHDAAHGFRTGRSVRSFVEPHAGRALVLKLDLLDFFPTIATARVVALFRTAGYPGPVARTLAGLCVNRAPLGLWRRPDSPGFRGAESYRTRQLYRGSHLPQGAPTSPALANLCAHRLDARLLGLARSAGATYTRYADDLAFSGDERFARSVDRFRAHVGAIVLEEGFALHPRKTRVMRRSARQSLAGAVVNDRPNVARADFDALKATLHNCARTGPSGQNREAHDDFRAHLLGRIAHVATLNPARAAKLRAIFDRVEW